MSLLDLDLKNYNYYELLNLFKIDNENDNRTNMLYKIDNKVADILNGNFEEYIKKLERRVKSEEKKLQKNSKVLPTKQN